MNPELQAILDALNSVGTGAWEASVRYTFAQAATGMALGGALLTGSYFALRKALVLHKADNELMVPFFFAAALMGLVGFLSIAFGLPDLIEPAGGTIRDMIRAVGR